MQHRDIIIIKKIIQEIRVSFDIIGDADLEQFLASEMMKRASCMTVINIGELIKAMNMEVREQHKEIPWKNMAGFRDIAAHRYQTLNMEDVYITIKDEFPVILENIEKIDLTED